MTLEANLLRADAVRTTDQGYEVDLRLAWYRSLPLSCIENIHLNINGHTYGADELSLQYVGRSLSLADLEDMTDDWWFIQDPLTVLARQESPAAKGSTLQVEAELATRIPYIIIGPDMALVQRTNVAREVIAQ